MASLVLLLLLLETCKPKEWNKNMDILGQQNQKRQYEVQPLGAGEFPELEAFMAQEKADQDFYTRAVALEGRSLGTPGMTQIARAMENRLGMIQSGVAGPGEFMVQSNPNYRDPKEYGMTDILKGDGQFAVYDPETNSLPAQRSPVTEEDMMNAAEAIRIASDRELYMNFAEKEGLPPRSVENTGFRTTDAFIDPSQLEGQYQYGNTYFNQSGYRDY